MALDERRSSVAAAAADGVVRVTERLKATLSGLLLAGVELPEVVSDEVLVLLHDLELLVPHGHLTLGMLYVFNQFILLPTRDVKDLLALREPRRQLLALSRLTLEGLLELGDLAPHLL